MASTSSILSLSAELKLLVLSYCDRQDMLALRLSHSTWLPTTTEILFSSFSIGTFTWSFERLVHVSISRLVHVIRNLTIYSIQLDEPQSGHSWDPQTSYQDFKDQLWYCSCGRDSWGPDAFLPRLTCEHEAKYEQAWKVYQAYQQHTWELWTHQRYFQLFREAIGKFSKLASLDITQFHFLGTVHDATTLRSMLGDVKNTCLALAREMYFEISYPGNAPNASPSILHSLLASSEAFYQLRKLRIQQEYYSKWNLEDLSPLLNNLVDLELDIYHGFRRDGPALIQGKHEEVVALLKCPNLRSLTLKMHLHRNKGYSDSVVLYNSFFDSYFWPHLHSVQFLGASLSNYALETFLTRHNATLKSLVLKNFYIEQPEVFLRTLPSLVKLERIEVSELYDLSWYSPPYFRDGLDAESMSWLLTGEGSPPIRRSSDIQQ